MSEFPEKMTARQEALARIPADIAAASDYEWLAARFLAPATLAWIAGGSGEELTLRGNRDAYAKVALRNRLWDLPAALDTRLQLPGLDMAHPLLLAPVASQVLVHPQGEIATARGAQAVAAGMVASALASKPLQDIAACVERCCFQLYWQQNLARTLVLAEAAAEAGCKALILTLDTPVQTLSRGAQRAGFRLPANVRAPALDVLPPAPPASTTAGTGLTALLQQVPTLAAVRALVAAAPLPVLVKGVLYADDARALQDCGVHGLIVSNHGGRALDGVRSTLAALPAVRRATGPEFPLLLDGGIRSGYDVFKALALGADAVLVGRLQLYALAVAGPLGVAHMLRLLLEELQVCMALTGCASLARIGPHTLNSQEI